MDDQPNPDTWNVNDAVSLRNFIVAHPKFLRQLALKMPKIEGKTMEERAVTGSDANGYIAALKSIDQLMLDPTPSGDNAGFIEE